MKTVTDRTPSASFGTFAAAQTLPFMPRIAFAPEGDGNGGADDAAAKAAADKAAADKAAADKAAADKAAADKAAADKAAAEEEARKADLSKTVEDLAKEKAAAEKEKSDLLKEVMDKKNKNKELEAALKQFEGINPDEVRKLLAEKVEAEKNEAEKRGEFERVKQMMVEEHTKQLDAVKQQLADLQNSLSTKDKAIDELTIGTQFSNSKFIREDIVLSPAKARILYGSHFEMKDGVLVAYDKPTGSANRTPLTDASGNQLAFDDALAKLVSLDPDKDTILKSKMTPGGGSNTTNAKPGAVVQGAKTDELRGVKRIMAGLSKEVKSK